MPEKNRYSYGEQWPHSLVEELSWGGDPPLDYIGAELPPVQPTDSTLETPALGQPIEPLETPDHILE